MVVESFQRRCIWVWIVLPGPGHRGGVLAVFVDEPSAVVPDLRPFGFQEFLMV